MSNFRNTLVMFLRNGSIGMFTPVEREESHITSPAALMTDYYYKWQNITTSAAELILLLPLLASRGRPDNDVRIQSTGTFMLTMS